MFSVRPSKPGGTAVLPQSHVSLRCRTLFVCRSRFVRTEHPSSHSFLPSFLHPSLPPSERWLLVCPVRLTVTERRSEGLRASWKRGEGVFSSATCGPVIAQGGRRGVSGGCGVGNNMGRERGGGGGYSLHLQACS